MKENIELARNREFGDIISDTFVLIRQNFTPLLKAIVVICGLFLLTDIVISAFVAVNREDASIQTLAGFSKAVLGFIYAILLVLTTQAYFILYKEKGNTRPEVIEVWGYVKYYFFRVFFTEILLIIGIFIGAFLCFLPCVYLGVVFSLVLPVMMVENGNIEYSIRKAFKIIKGNWWFTFGIILLVSVITAVLMLILLIPVGIVYGVAGWLTGKNVDEIAGVFFAVDLNLCKLLWIIPNIALILVYFALTEEKEGTSLIDRINSFGKSSPGTDQISSEQY